MKRRQGREEEWGTYIEREEGERKKGEEREGGEEGRKRREREEKRGGKERGERGKGGERGERKRRRPLLSASYLHSNIRTTQAAPIFYSRCAVCHGVWHS